MPLPPYSYTGARSMVILHERELRRFVAVWRQAASTGTPLPPNTYSSYDEIVQHVLRAARGYMIWMCEKLGLPDPGIPPTPPPEQIAGQVEEYLEQVLAGWRDPLKEIHEDRFGEVYPSRWKVDYCIDAMMEHAVMHPIRHSHQLEMWMKG